MLGEHHDRGLHPVDGGTLGYSHGVTGADVAEGVHGGQADQGAGQ
jgi:hypothetical protein